MDIIYGGVNINAAGWEGNSLVYGIHVVEISAYMLKYQHC